jgi:preprotein translocase subunit Sec61beta
MAKKDSSRLPSGMGGLVRYGEEIKESIKVRPEHVLYFTLGLIAIEVVLKFLA